MALARLSVVLVVSVCLSALHAEEPIKYGKEITLKEKTEVGEILSNPEEYHGRRVLVEGRVLDVCSHRGCWIRIGGRKDGEAIQFKVEDGVIVFRAEEKGKIALAEGIVFVKEYTIEELTERAKHEAEEHGTEFDPSKITGPRKVVRIDGEGAVIH